MALALKEMVNERVALLTMLSPSYKSGHSDADGLEESRLSQSQIYLLLNYTSNTFVHCQWQYLLEVHQTWSIYVNYA